MKNVYNVSVALVYWARRWKTPFANKVDIDGRGDRINPIRRVKNGWKLANNASGRQWRKFRKSSFWKSVVNGMDK